MVYGSSVKKAAVIGLAIVLALGLLMTSAPAAAHAQFGNQGNQGNVHMDDPEPPQSYEVPIDLPACDAADPEVKIIENDGDWQSINNPEYRIFCVVPGDYTGVGELTITADGTEHSPRWIRWFDPGNPQDATTHPYHMKAKQLVLMNGPVFDKAHYWIVDRIRFDTRLLITQAGNDSDGSDPEGFSPNSGSSHIVLNRLLFWEMKTTPGNDSIIIRGESHHNTVQNSVIAKTAPIPGSDAAGVYIHNSDNNVITKNEIFDIPGDSIQTGQSDAHAKQTIIWDNDLYITSEMYTDGEGRLTPDGTYACAENAIDVKATIQPASAIVEPDEYSIIGYNRMWGFREADEQCGSTGSGGYAMVIHYETSRGWDVHHNYIWDCRIGFSIEKPNSPTRQHLYHDNVLWDLFLQGMRPKYITSAEVYNNVIIDTPDWFLIQDKSHGARDITRNVHIYHNVVINADKQKADAVYDESNVIEANAYYHSTAPNFASHADGSLFFSNVATAGHKHLKFYNRRITHPNSTVLIPHGKVTGDSPHADWFGL